MYQMRGKEIVFVEVAVVAVVAVVVIDFSIFLDHLLRALVDQVAIFPQDGPGIYITFINCYNFYCSLYGQKCHSY